MWSFIGAPWRLVSAIFETYLPEEWIKIQPNARRVVVNRYNTVIEITKVDFFKNIAISNKWTFNANRRGLVILPKPFSSNEVRLNRFFFIITNWKTHFMWIRYYFQEQINTAGAKVEPKRFWSHLGVLHPIKNWKL